MSWDDPRFPAGFARRPVTLRALAAHAAEIVRSDPEYHPVLIQHPRLRADAATLSAAVALGAEMPDLLAHATRFGRTLVFVQNEIERRRSTPKPKKGVAALDIVEASRQRKEAARPANIKFPVDGLWGTP